MATRLTNFGPNAPPSVVEYVAELGAKAPVEVWGDLLGSLIEMDLGDALAKISVPTLILAADVDRLTPPASAVAMKHRLPNARLVLFKGAGHCTMLERHEQFNRVVGRFLRDVVPAANEPGPVVVHRAPLEARKGGT
jgi:pimeloyl-ACP methyl ester carboxylesterase